VELKFRELSLYGAVTRDAHSLSVFFLLAQPQDVLVYSVLITKLTALFTRFYSHSRLLVMC